MIRNSKTRILGSIIFAVIFYPVLESGHEIAAIIIASLAILLALTAFFAKKDTLK